MNTGESQRDIDRCRASQHSRSMGLIRPLEHHSRPASNAAWMEVMSTVANN
jgi:hypothetical protein